MPLVSTIAGQVLDDVYVVEVPSPPTIQGVQVGTVGMVGTFSQGIPTAIYSISDYPTAVRLLGKSQEYLGGPIALQNLLRQRAGNIQVVPVFAPGAQAARATLYNTDATPQEYGILTAAQRHPQTGGMVPLYGDGPNNWKITVKVPSTPNGTFSLSIDTGDVVETFDGLSSFDWVNTVNAKSNLVLAKPPESGPSMGNINPGSFYFFGGSGTQFPQPSDMDAAMIGSVAPDGTATGLQLLATRAPGDINILFAAEYTSYDVNSAIINIAYTNNCIALLSAHSNDGVSQIVSQANGYNKDNVALVDGFTYCYDADTASTRSCSPTSLVAGMASRLGPQYSWGNKPIFGTQGLVTPRSTADLVTLQQAGVLCLSNSIPRGGFGTRSGIASDGSELYVRRMRYFLEFSIMSKMGWAVDALQSTSSADPLRRDVTQAIARFLNTLANPVDPTQKVIDSFVVTCNKTNNPDEQIAQGLLNVSVVVRLLAAARQVVISANISTSAITASSTAQ